MSTKGYDIQFGINKIQEVLKALNPEKKWDIVYCAPGTYEDTFDDWTIQYHNIVPGEEYIFICDADNHLLYAINVTGDSVLCALEELMEKLVDKF